MFTIGGFGGCGAFHENEFGYSTCWVEAACIQSFGMPKPRTGYGVYFGPNHPFNISAHVEQETSQDQAEIVGAIAAIEALKSLDMWMIQINTTSEVLTELCAKEYLPRLDACRPSGMPKLFEVYSARKVALEDLEVRHDLMHLVFDLSDASYNAVVIYDRVSQKMTNTGSLEASKLALAGAVGIPMPHFYY